MYDKAYVGFVDAHAEGDGGDDDVDFFFEEGVLVVAAGLGVHAGVVGAGFDVVGFEDGGELFYFFAGQAVDYAALAGVVFDEFYDVLVDVVCLGPYFVVEVGAIERGGEFGGVCHAEVFLYVGFYLGGGGGGEGDDGRAAYLVNRGTDVAVFGTEVVAPFRYAVGFVDGIE